MPGNSQYLEWEFEKLKRASENMVTSSVNPVTGGVSLSAGGSDLLQAIGLRKFIKACFPCNQTGTSANLPLDYSRVGVAAAYGVNLSTPWATAGYLQTPGGSNQHIDIVPLTYFSPDMFVDSFVVTFTVKKAAPGADSAFFGNGASSTNRGFYINALTTGKIGVVVNTNTGAQFSVIATSVATVFDNTDHTVTIGLDGPNKIVKIWIDGVFDSSGSFTITASTLPVYNLTIGRAGGSGNTIAMAMYGVAVYQFQSSALPVNIDDLAKCFMSSRRAPGLSEDLQAFF